MKKAWVLLLSLALFSCATYHQKNRKFNKYFESGQLEDAYKLLANDKGKHRKDKLIFLLNKGVVSSMLDKYEESNEYFESAYRIADDMRKNYLNEGVAFLTNPGMVAYKGEDFEVLFIHYYKALNFLKLNQPEKALVEVKRMNIELNQLNDKYKPDSRYKKDAFVHLLMGVIYDVNKDYNDAFIAYRNSYQIYQEDYKKMFGLEAPEQLKKDLLRTAYLTGFNDELRFYEKKFGMNYKHSKKDAELVFLWQNGLGPVKDQWSINFFINRVGNEVFFVNKEIGVSFNYRMEEDQYKSSGLSDLQFIRVAFPKYVERPAFYKSGSVIVNDQKYALEKAEDISQIAFKSLQDRMHVELGKGLLRFALKKATEVSVRDQNKELGAALGILNAVTEQADTRFWPTLPGAIHYTRVPLKQGQQEVKLAVTEKSGTGERVYNFTYDVSPGETVFQSFHTLEAGR